MPAVKPYIHPNTPRKLISAYRRAKNRRGEGYKIHVLAKQIGLNVGYLHKLIKQGIEPPDDTAKGQAARMAMFLPRKRRVQRKPKLPQSQQPGQERDYFQTPNYATDLIAPYLKSIIWEPAAGQGKIAKRLQEKGFNVVETDIQTGKNFLTCDEPYFVQTIVTNPPFSLKRQFFARCIEIGRPFALLIPTDMSIWTIRAIQDGCQWLIPTRRIDYITPNGKQGRESASQFHSGWLTRGLNLQQQINIVELTLEQKKNNI